MARKSFTLSTQARDELVAQADALAVSLAEGDLNKSEASDLVAAVVGDALELAAGCMGAPDGAQKLVSTFGEGIVKAIAEAVKPNLERLHERAVAAMQEGNFDKARRLMDRIDKIKARREGGE